MFIESIVIFSFYTHETYNQQNENIMCAKVNITGH